MTIEAVGEMVVHRAGPDGYKRTPAGGELLRHVVWWKNDDHPNGTLISNLIQNVIVGLSDGAKIKVTFEVVK